MLPCPRLFQASSGGDSTRSEACHCSLADAADQSSSVLSISRHCSSLGVSPINIEEDTLDDKVQMAGTLYAESVHSQYLCSMWALADFIASCRFDGNLQNLLPSLAGFLPIRDGLVHVGCFRDVVMPRLHADISAGAPCRGRDAEGPSWRIRPAALLEPAGQRTHAA